MKKLFLVFLFTVTGFAINAHASAVDSIPVNMKDVESIDAIIHSLYDVISGPKGEKRNWERMRTLFITEGRLIGTGKASDGSFRKRVMTVEDYIKSSGPVIEDMGFFEREIGRKTEQFGNIAHVFSTYDTKRQLADVKPFMRGINSIQLFFDNTRWWIVTVFWQNESEETPIPKKYLND